MSNAILLNKNQILLQKEFDFNIDNENPLSKEEIEEICRKIAKYSVKTNHPQFHNQLFSGICPIALAAQWMSDALNTSNLNKLKKNFFKN